MRQCSSGVEYFESEVVKVVEAVAASFEDFDFIIESLADAVGNGVLEVG